MPTIAEEISRALRLGKDKGVLAVDLRLLIRANEGFKDQMDVFLHRDEEMKDLALFRAQVERLLSGEPVELILGEAEFLGHRLKVTRDTLIPRGETEELVALLTQIAPRYWDARNFLVCCDIGTGSGAIAIALKAQFPNWVVSGTDISQAALEVAKENIENEGLPIRLFQGDALEPLIRENIAADIIVSNPPYVLSPEDAQPSVRDYEPSSALYFNPDDNVYEKVIRDVRKVKKGALLLAFEIDPGLKDYLDGLMSRYLSDYECTYKEDLNGFLRFLFIYLR